MDKFAVIGKNISYSLSPFINKRLFEIRNREVDYSLLDVSDLSEVNIRDYRGLSVTIPYKHEIISFLDDANNITHLNSCNCIDNRGGFLTGYNTDIYGLRASIPRNALKGFVLLYGYGGLGSAVAKEVEAQSGYLLIVCRNGSRGLSEARLFARDKDKVHVLTEDNFDGQYKQYTNISGKFNILINTTPVGTNPDFYGCVASDDAIKSSDFVFDAVYNPAATELIRRAARYGIKCESGMRMLVLQAAKAHEIWHGDIYHEAEISKIVTECYALLEECNE